MNEQPWYRRWFGDAYKQLYPHRDLEQAELQVDIVLRELPVTPEWRILDIGCGAGRHLGVLRRKGFRKCLGVDLSLALLRDARSGGLAVARADMRGLPFRPHGFDLVTSFFTSFGYFATFAEDVATFGQFASLLKPGGFLFLDLMDKEYLVKHLVPSDTSNLGDATLEQKRRIENGCVFKEIKIQKPGQPPERFEEQVRLYSLHEAHALAKRFSLRPVKSFGDESGGEYVPGTSQRMSLLFQAFQAAG